MPVPVPVSEKLPVPDPEEDGVAVVERRPVEPDEAAVTVRSMARAVFLEAFRTYGGQA